MYVPPLFGDLSLGIRVTLCTSDAETPDDCVVVYLRGENPGETWIVVYLGGGTSQNMLSSSSEASFPPAPKAPRVELWGYLVFGGSALVPGDHSVSFPFLYMRQSLLDVYL